MSAHTVKRQGRRTPPGWLPGKAAAGAYVGMNRKWIYEQEQAGRLHGVKINSRLTMYRIEDLDAAILAMGAQFAEQEADNRSVPARPRKPCSTEASK